MTISESEPKLRVREKLGSLLVADGLVNEAQLQLALGEQRTTGERLGRILVTSGAITEAQLLRALARHLGLDAVDLDEYVVDPTASQLLREGFVRRNHALPIGFEDGRLVVAMVNPSDVFAIDDMRSLTNHEIKPVLVDPSQVARAIDAVWSSRAEAMMRAASDSVEEEEGAPAPAAGVVDPVQDGPVVQFVNELLNRAVRDRASDIHFEPQLRELRIRFRIDGVLHDVMSVPQSIRASVVSRLKIMGELDIAERRLPQDGRITLNIAGGQVDLRLVTLPTSHGEALVIRILDRSTGLLQMDELGFLPETLAAYRSCYQRPWGAMLVTGPTGAGKSTTLYAALTELHDPRRNIVTVEDPVEYDVAGVKQLQVNRKAGLTFAGALRSIVRADPDVIMVGEIRDTETATIAVEAALTGHLVLSTLHANDAASTPNRLLDMGVEPFLLTSALTGVLAQRLVRQLCDRCKVPHQLRADELAAAGWDDRLAASVGEPQFYRAVGCGYCSRSGYRGRFAIHEVMQMTEDLSHLVLSRASSDQVRARAVEQGMRPLQEDGLRKVALGRTTFEELLRVTV